jgi:protein O-mannosyl-transferase
MSGTDRADSTVRLFPLLLLAAAIVGVFWPVCTHEFVRWDDTHNLVANPDMNPPTLAGVARYWDFRRPFKDLYIPLTYSVWSAVAWMDVSSSVEGPALNPYLFHTVNLAVHLLSAAACHIILLRLLKSGLAAWMGALLFAIHPVQVESVAWISGLKDVLAGLLTLTAVWQYIEYADPAGEVGAGKRRLQYALATAAFLLAMLAKPSAVVAPLLAGIIDGLLLRRPARKWIIPVGAWLVLAIPFVVIGRYAQPADRLAFVPPPWARPIVALDALAFYVQQLLLPLRLGIDYGRSPQWLWQSRQIYFTWLVPMGLLASGLVFFFIRRKQARPDGAAVIGLASVFLFIAALLPTLGLVPFDFQSYSTVADHYLYIPMLAPAMLLAAALAHRNGRVPAIVAVVILCLLGIQTFRQVWHWRDSSSLFSHAVEVNPTSLAGNVNLGNVLFDEALAAGRFGNAPSARKHALEAEVRYRAALVGTPNDADARANLGNTLLLLNRANEAIVQYQAALTVNPTHAVAQRGLANAMRKAATRP